MNIQNLSKLALTLAGVFYFVGALFHIACIIGGPDWVTFAGAPQWVAQSLEDGTWSGPAITLAIAAMLFIWAAFAFSVSGRFRPLPFRKTIVMLISLLMTLRGSVIIFFLFSWPWDTAMGLFHGIISLVILGVGLTSLAGLFFLVRSSRRRAQG